MARGPRAQPVRKPIDALTGRFRLWPGTTFANGEKLMPGRLYLDVRPVEAAKLNRSFVDEDLKSADQPSR